MSIKDWPITERPREKLLHLGAENLSDAELLAVFLGNGIKGKTAVDLARDLLQHVGNLRTLMTLDKNAFCSIKGLGIAKFTLLQAALEITRRHFKQTLDRQSVLLHPIATRHYLTTQLRDYQDEVFACVFLDNQHRIISFDILFKGTIDVAHVHPRTVIKKTLYYNARAIILAHNHPSGSATPSPADQHMTKHLTQALALIDVHVLDHVIIGDGETTSFAEMGLL